MNKTIINGIDVSECKHLYIPQETKIYQCLICETGEFVQCKRESNCYYKQLKRLQQELDIKEKMLDKFMIGSGETLEKLQEENEELKEKIDIYESSIIANHDRAVGKRLVEVLLALEEIREDLEQDTTCESRECGCDDYGECLKCVKETILDKINEVLNDRN